MSPQNSESTSPPAIATALGRFCAGLLDMRSYSEYADIEAGLHKVEVAIRDTAPTLTNDFAISAVHQTVAWLLDSIISHEVSSNFRELTFIRAMECYAVFVPLLRNEGQITDALHHIEAYLNGGAFAYREAVRNLIVPLVGANCGNPGLLDFYHGVLLDTEERARGDTIMVALYGLTHICDSPLGSSDLHRFLRASLNLVHRYPDLLATILPTVFKDVVDRAVVLNADQLNDLDEQAYQFERKIAGETPAAEGIRIIRSAIDEARKSIS